MKINIFSDDAATAFADAQKLARVRTVSIEEARAFVAKLETRLKGLGVPVRLWQGMDVTVSPHCHSFPGAYKGNPEGTYYRVRRGASKWYLTHVGRERVDKSTENVVSAGWSSDQARREVGEYLHRAFVRGLV